MSNLFRLNLNDLVKGAVTAVVAGFVFTLGGLLQTTGFNLFSANWGEILTTAVNAGFAALVGYLGKNLLTDDKGGVLGSKIGRTE